MRFLLCLLLSAAAICAQAPGGAPAEFQVGPQSLSDGTRSEARLAKTREIVISDAHGKYYEGVSRGKTYHACMQAGASLGTALTGTAVTMTVYNPVGSGVLCAIQGVSIGVTTIMANPGAPANATSIFVHAVGAITTSAAPTATTAASIRNNLIGSAPGVCSAFTAATLPAAPVVARVIGGMSVREGTVAAFADTAYTITDYTDGKIVLLPNTSDTIQAIGAAISGVVCMDWEEIPIS